MDNGYHVKLYYGFQNTESGIYHAFEATDPEDASDSEAEDRMAELLDTTLDDDRFDCNSMLIRLPDSVVKRIKDDGVKEYLSKSHFFTTEKGQHREEGMR